MNSLEPFIHHALEDRPDETHNDPPGPLPGGKALYNANHCVPYRQKFAQDFLEGKVGGDLDYLNIDAVTNDDGWDETEETVERLQKWREDAPYG